MMKIKMLMILMMIILNNCPAYKSSLEGRQGFDVGRDDASGVELGKVAVIMMMEVLSRSSDGGCNDHDDKDEYDYHCRYTLRTCDDAFGFFRLTSKNLHE